MRKLYLLYICIHKTRQRTDKGFSMCEHTYKAIVIKLKGFN